MGQVGGAGGGAGGRGGGVKRTWVAAAEDTDPEIPGKLGGSGMQSCELPVKPSKSQKSSFRKKCQGKENKGLSPKYVFHGRWKKKKRQREAEGLPWWSRG